MDRNRSLCAALTQVSLGGVLMSVKGASDGAQVSGVTRRGDSAAIRATPAVKP
jgi:hypothetical protein